MAVVVVLLVGVAHTDLGPGILADSGPGILADFGNLGRLVAVLPVVVLLVLRLNHLRR